MRLAVYLAPWQAGAPSDAWERCQAALVRKECSKFSWIKAMRP